MLTIAFTGHRPNKLGNDYDLVSDKVLGIRHQIIEIIHSFDLPRNEITGIVGMALGIDILAALLLWDMSIEYIAAVPCRSQEKMWPRKSQIRYFELLKLAKEVHYISEEYDVWCMQKRNKWMVDHSDVLIAVWDGTKGGTANCINYAQKIGKRVIIIKI